MTDRNAALLKTGLRSEGCDDVLRLSLVDSVPCAPVEALASVLHPRVRTLLIEGDVDGRYERESHRVVMAIATDAVSVGLGLEQTAALLTHMEYSAARQLRQHYAVNTAKVIEHAYRKALQRSGEGARWQWSNLDKAEGLGIFAGKAGASAFQVYVALLDIVGSVGRCEIAASVRDLSERSRLRQPAVIGALKRLTAAALVVPQEPPSDVSLFHAATYLLVDLVDPLASDPIQSTLLSARRECKEECYGMGHPEGWPRAAGRYFESSTNANEKPVRTRSTPSGLVSAGTHVGLQHERGPLERLRCAQRGWLRLLLVRVGDSCRELLRTPLGSGTDEDGDGSCPRGHPRSRTQHP
jgi:hypothetical protein